MLIKAVVIIALIIGIFLAFKLLLFLVRSTLGIGWGIVKALFFATILLAISGVIIYLYLRFKMLDFFNLGL